MLAILNIRVGRVPVPWVVDAARLQWLRVKSSTVLGTGAERTIVIEVETDHANPYPVYDLARALNEDCIALYVPDLQHGALVGPKAERWGEFDPSRFLLPDGTHPL